MFKFRKRNLIQNVHRVEDLQIGDIIQYDLYSRAEVKRLLEINKNDFHVTVERIPLNGHSGDIETMVLHRDLKIFVWR